MSDRTAAAAFRAAAVLSAVLLGAGMNPAQAVEAPPGALSCTGCHPAHPNADTPVSRLNGRDATTIVTAMQAFRSGQRPATLMDRIAKGFSDDEIAAIAAWFMTQR